jgi:hypothetical protein
MHLVIELLGRTVMKKLLAEREKLRSDAAGIETSDIKTSVGYHAPRVVNLGKTTKIAQGNTNYNTRDVNAPDFWVQ